MTQISRAAGQSAIASAAYRAGEKLHSDYYGEDSDYTGKSGVRYSEILLPPHAPERLRDREILWNEVERAERRKDAQLAYSFDIALQNELSFEENLELAKQFLQENFVAAGMIVDFAIHDPERNGTQNPHFHVMAPIRPLNQDGTWGAKQRMVYRLMKMVNGFRNPMESMPLTLSHHRLGTTGNAGIAGGKPGQTWSTRSWTRRGWTTESIIAPTPIRRWISCLQSTRAWPFGRWSSAVSVQKKAT